MGWRVILAIAAVCLVLEAPAAAMDDKMHGHGDTKGAQGAPDMEKMGDKVFSGKVGPWAGEARLVDMKAQMEKAGVSAKALAKLPANYHLMVILNDPKTGKPVTELTGGVEITGPDKGSSSNVTLIVMGKHIGADVNLPKAGKYTFRVKAEGGGQKGTAVFDHQLKK